MRTLTYIRNDIRQIVREPIMVMLMFVPLLLVVLFKCFIIFLFPWILSKTGFDITEWYPYLFSFLILLIPGMLGAVTGFMMIDDRDGNIFELMSVTPMGRSGYLFNRLMLAALICVTWFLVAYVVLGIVRVPFVTLMLLAVMMIIESAVFALLLFRFAGDKVGGLTIAKGLNIISMFALTDILSLPWLTCLSWFFPAYWVTALIKQPASLATTGIALFVHMVWFCLLLYGFGRRKY